MVSSVHAGHDAIDRRPLIIGAGPAGLAVGACLKRAGVDCTILEQGGGAGTA